MKLLGTKNAKTVKGEKLGYLTAITYLAPSDASGVINTCPSASKGCRAACLFTAGRGRMDSIMQARVDKTKFFANEQRAFLLQLKREIAAFVKSAARKGFKPCLRLNGTSDLPWESIKINGQSIIELFPDVQFYDYTKSATRIQKFLGGELPANYHLTFSRSENTKDAFIEYILKNGGNVAVVYSGELPQKDFGGFDVINGDKTDLRFLDGKDKIVGLIAKGDAKKDKSGFVRA